MAIPNGTTLVAGTDAVVQLSNFKTGEFDLPVNGEVPVPEGTQLVLIPKAEPADARKPEPAR